ncbi:hypothetical protein ACR75P_05240 [Faecalicoccus pleomorphus]|uniref:hypothetical protein n=1 Tax=Faecalicoccus pleomorphus TaxID=1323 RepID=UPI003DA3EBB4
MEIVTGYVGRAHITAEQDRLLNRAIFGNDSVITNLGMKMRADLISNNEIRIRDGGLMQQGCFAIIPINTYESITVSNGSQGMNRISLIVSRYEKNSGTGIESIRLKIIDGTPTSLTPTVPAYVKGNIANGDLVDEFPLYKVNLKGLNITSIEPLAKPVLSMAEAVYRKEG